MISSPDRRPTLFIVPTPLGNLGDVTLRALEILRSVAVIAAEDTRRTRILLERHGIATRPSSLHRFNESRAATWLVSELEAGRDVAYVTDAGTPGVSDPGARLVARARELGFTIIPLPGPCAAVTALSASGWEGPFVFEGYLARKGKERERQLDRLVREDRAVILYEAPTRIRATLEDLKRAVPTRPVLLAREMTKVHEQYLLATAGAHLDSLPDPVKGEITLVVLPDQEAENEPPPDEPLQRASRAALALVASGTGLKDACAALASVTGLSSRAIYQAALALQRASGP